MPEYCSTCLSVERKLISISNETDKSIYLNVFDKLSVNIMNICWECQAIFLKISKFKIQIIQAQDLIKSWTDEKPKQTTSFSSLSFYTKSSYDQIYEYDIKTETSTDPELPNIDTEIEDIWSNKSNIDPDNDQDLIKTKEEIEKTNDHLLLQNNTNEEIKSCVGNTEIPSADIDINNLTVKIQSVANKKNRKKKTKKGFTKEKFIVLKLNEDEIMKNREIDRDAPRYKRCTFKCEKCIMGYYDEQKYKRHLQEKHSENAGQHICPICETRFSRTNFFKHHIKSHYQSFKCKLCDVTHHRLNTILIHHAKCHEGETKYVCAICEKVFDAKRSLRYHRDKEHRELPKCQLCEKSFSSNASLKTHVSTHTITESLHPCTMCDRTYKTPQSLRAHARSHLEIHDNAYCIECDKEFRSTRVYARHLAEHRAHIDEKDLKFPCNQCDAKFVLKSYLKRHISRKHLKLQPYTCDLCEKTFTARDRLKSHIMEKHEGITKPKNKLCSYCGKGFSKRSTLTNHLRTHTGERPFSCEVCDASFAQKSALNTHNRALHSRVTKGME